MEQQSAPLPSWIFVLVGIILTALGVYALLLNLSTRPIPWISMATSAVLICCSVLIIIWTGCNRNSQ